MATDESNEAEADGVEEPDDDEPAVEDAPSSPRALDEHEQRLRELAHQRADEKVTEPRRLWRLLIGGFVALVIVAYVIPSMLDSERKNELTLERSLYYCKAGQMEMVECTERVRTRHALCWRREMKKKNPNDDEYGRCMHESFDDFYYHVGRHMPKEPTR